MKQCYTPPWVFFTFLKLYKWYQIAQRITDIVIMVVSLLTRFCILQSQTRNDDILALLFLWSSFYGQVLKTEADNNSRVYMSHWPSHTWSKNSHPVQICYPLIKILLVQFSFKSAKFYGFFLIIAPINVFYSQIRKLVTWLWYRKKYVGLPIALWKPPQLSAMRLKHLL